MQTLVSIPIHEPIAYDGISCKEVYSIKKESRNSLYIEIQRIGERKKEIEIIPKSQIYHFNKNSIIMTEETADNCVLAFKEKIMLNNKIKTNGIEK